MRVVASNTVIGSLLSVINTNKEMVFVDMHMGVSRWREEWVTKRANYNGKKVRVPGIWDSSIQRQTLVLKDNRKLTYFLDGPVRDNQTSSNSLPHIFVFHAMLLSGNSFIMKEPPQDYVLVCINRPGYFGSDLLLGNNEQRQEQEYCYRTFAGDMEQLADHLNVHNFLVAGHSSGGPCALACAAYLSRRVKAVGILSGDPEYAHDGVPDKRKMNVFCLGYFLPFFLKYIIPFLPWARNSRKGMVNDYRLETTLYPFRTEHITQPTLVYVGEDDKVMPMDVSRHVHERLDNSQLRVVPGIGHMGLLRDFILRDFFDSLVSLLNEVEQGIEIETRSKDLPIITKRGSDGAENNEQEALV